MQLLVKQDIFTGQASSGSSGSDGEEGKGAPLGWSQQSCDAKTRHFWPKVGQPGQVNTLGMADACGRLKLLGLNKIIG